MQIIDRLLPPGHPMRPGRPMRGGRPSSITVHYTANTNPGADALMHARYMEQTNRVKSSWHYTVDGTRVVRHIPETEEAWHAGRRDGNQTSIGVETCVDPSSAAPGGPIYLTTFGNLVELLADICWRYDWPADADHIREHRSWTGKDCPKRSYVDIDRVRAAVADRLASFANLTTGGGSPEFTA